MNLIIDGADGQPCPYGYQAEGGRCFPIYKTFREWAEETEIGVIIPDRSSDQVTYDEFMQIVKETVSSPYMMEALRETYCKSFETVIDKGRKYQHEFNLKMAKYNNDNTPYGN